MHAFPCYQVIIRDNPREDSAVIHSLRNYEVQEQDGYVLILELHYREAVQAEYGPERETVQLDDELLLQNVNATLWKFYEIL